MTLKRHQNDHEQTKTCAYILRAKTRYPTKTCTRVATGLTSYIPPKLKTDRDIFKPKYHDVLQAEGYEQARGQTPTYAQNHDTENTHKKNTKKKTTTNEASESYYLLESGTLASMLVSTWHTMLGIERAT